MAMSNIPYKNLQQPSYRQRYAATYIMQFTDPQGYTKAMKQWQADYPGDFIPHQLEALCHNEQNRDTEAQSCLARAAELCPPELEEMLVRDFSSPPDATSQPLEVVPGSVWRMDSLHTVGNKAQVQSNGWIVALSCGGLLLHNPVKPQPGVFDSIRALGKGPVRFIMSNTMYHNLYLAAYSREFPEARVLGPPAHKSRSDLTDAIDYSGFLTEGGEAELPEEIVAVAAEGHDFGDVYLFHKPSGCVFPGETCLVLGKVEGPSRKTWVWFGGIPKIGIYEFQVTWGMWKDRDAWRRFAAVAKQWDVKRICPIHGSILESKAKERFEKFLDDFVEDRFNFENPKENWIPFD